jgi:antitoxin component YwqK of YwqJK toxin-antitoxin module
LALLATGCTARTIERPGPGISYEEVRLHYRGEIYTGIVRERFAATGTVRDTHYRNGRPDGEQREWVPATGRQVARLEYTAGEKTGVHEGWFLDGKRRFHYEYDAGGKPHGEFWEWHQNGRPSLFARFEHGRLLGKKVWRADGQIYLNQAFAPAKAFGLPGTQLCLQLRGEVKASTAADAR